ncbi:LAMI_0C05358g1_1 [Lachancea mirantina]|uniref:LAMI_0C05358g1_1 n=1 Tax=Lachancea mirantina TaxID=1230905 RepID=A0A1G4J2T5_9SACH|nr:LAMI_0C05358g1_1 [Lachancea mirantina]
MLATLTFPDSRHGSSALAGPAPATAGHRCIALHGARGNHVLLPAPQLTYALQPQLSAEAVLKRELDRCAFGSAAGAAAAARAAAPAGATAGATADVPADAGSYAAHPARLLPPPSPPASAPEQTAGDHNGTGAFGALQRHSVARAARKARAHSVSAAGSPGSAGGAAVSVPIEQRRRYLCKTCSKGFTTSGHLARHNRIHTGEKNHVCPYEGCGQRFSRHDNCVQHFKTHLRR